MVLDMKTNMKKRTILCLYAIVLSGVFLLSQGCGNAEQNDTADQQAQTDALQEKDPKAERNTDGSNASGPESGTNTDTSANDSGTPAVDSESQNTPGVSDTGLASPSVNGALHVEGTQLVDQNGAPVQLRGISTHGIAWFPDYINEDCFRQLRGEWNANVIRLAMYTAEYGGYCSGGDQDALKRLIQDGVAYAEKQDLYVIIDWHVLSDANPNLYLEEAKAFFQEMAGKYAGSDHVLYEICNEPNGGTTWGEIKSYAEEVIPVIRAQDEDAVILVGTPNWSQFVDQAAADPITGYDDLMYTLHFYAATHTDDLRATMGQAVENGLPVFVSEYGICDASGSGAIDVTQANAWIEALDQYGISYVAWNLSNKEETSAMLQSGCGRTSGFTPEDLSESGKWVYQMLRDHKQQKQGR